MNVAKHKVTWRNVAATALRPLTISLLVFAKEAECGKL